jgi:hypothetical protein
MNRAERRRQDRLIEAKVQHLQKTRDFSRFEDPKVQQLMKEVIDNTDKYLQENEVVQDPCYYCGDTQSPAFVIKERNDQIICVHCSAKGVGKYDTSWQRK